MMQHQKLQRKLSMWITSTPNSMSAPVENHDNDTHTNVEILFEGKKNYASLAICVNFTFTLYKNQNIIEVRAVLVGNKSVEGHDPTSILYLSNSLIEASCDSSEVEACIQMKKEEFRQKHDIRHATMTSEEVLKVQVLRELSVVLIKNRLYVLPSKDFEVFLKVLPGDMVDQDGKHTFYVDDKSEQQKLVFYRRILFRQQPEETSSNVTVAADSIMFSSKEPRHPRDWTASLRLLDPSFAKDHLPSVLEAKNSELLIVLRFLVHRLIVKGRFTLMKRRLERIMIDNEPLPIPYPVPQPHASEGNKKKYKDALEKAKNTRLRLRQTLRNNDGSVGEHSRRYSFLYQNLTEDNPYCPIKAFIVGDYVVPGVFDNTGTTGLKSKQLKHRGSCSPPPKKGLVPPISFYTPRTLGNRGGGGGGGGGGGSSSRVNMSDVRGSARLPSGGFVSSRSQKSSFNVAAVNPLDSPPISPLNDVDRARAPQSSRQSNPQRDMQSHLIIDRTTQLDIDSRSNEETHNPTNRERVGEICHTGRRDVLMPLEQHGHCGKPSLSSSPPLSSLSPSSPRPDTIDERTESTRPHPSQIIALPSQIIALPSQIEDSDKSDDDDCTGDGESLDYKEQHGGSGLDRGFLSPLPLHTIEQHKLNPIDKRRASGSQIILSPSLLSGGTGSAAGMMARAGSEKSDSINNTTTTTNNNQSVVIPTSTTIKAILADSRREQNIIHTTTTTTTIDKSPSQSSPTIRPATTASRPRPRAMSQSTILLPLVSVSLATKDKQPSAAAVVRTTTSTGMKTSTSSSVLSSQAGSTGMKTSSSSSGLSSQADITSKDLALASGSNHGKKSRSNRPSDESRLVNTQRSSMSSISAQHESQHGLKATNPRELTRSEVMMNGLRNGQSLSQLFGDVFGDQMSESLMLTTDRLVQESVQQQQQQQQEGGSHVALTLAVNRDDRCSWGSRDSGGTGGTGVISTDSTNPTTACRDDEDPKDPLEPTNDFDSEVDLLSQQPEGIPDHFATVETDNETDKEIDNETDTTDGKDNNV